jgi:glucose-1-phosphate adenylyltransferase
LCRTTSTHAAETPILDKDCRIGSNVRIINEAGHIDFDDPEERLHIRDGIVCVPRGAILPDGFKI